MNEIQTTPFDCSDYERLSVQIYEKATNKAHRAMKQLSCAGSGLQTEAACSTEDVVSGQIASTQLPHSGE